MKKNIFYMGMIAVAIGAASCNNSGNSSTSTDTSTTKQDTGTSAGSDTSSSAKIQPNPSPVSKEDSAFMIKAANAGMTEVALGNIATKNSMDDKVKAFGEMMVKDHSAAGDQLKKIASSKNINLPDAVNEESKKHIDDMEKKKGKDFDKAYVNMMIEGHEKVLKEFEDIQQKGSDAELKAFVTQTIPVIKGHLDSIKAIKKEMK
ncbi:MAG: DUF4142 domain-containing protein [Chitinophagaceae bacterium]